MSFEKSLLCITNRLEHRDLFKSETMLYNFLNGYFIVVGRVCWINL